MVRTTSDLTGPRLKLAETGVEFARSKLAITWRAATGASSINATLIEQFLCLESSSFAMNPAERDSSSEAN
jgi:hypothetical protein